MMYSWTQSDLIRGGIFIPKYYDPVVSNEIRDLSETHEIWKIRDLVDNGWLETATGDEIGKAAYGTGDIPFVRTSDIANWEIKSAPKQGVSRDIFEEYAPSQDVQAGDILFVRDGTYLIGNNCFITPIEAED